MKCGVKECESTNCFQKCGSKDCNPSIFYEVRKQKLRGFTQKLEKFTLNNANFSMHKLHNINPRVEINRKTEVNHSPRKFDGFGSFFLNTA